VGDEENILGEREKKNEEWGLKMVLMVCLYKCFALNEREVLGKRK